MAFPTLTPPRLSPLIVVAPLASSTAACARGWAAAQPAQGVQRRGQQFLQWAEEARHDPARRRRQRHSRAAQDGDEHPASRPQQEWGRVAQRRRLFTSVAEWKRKGGLVALRCESQGGRGISVAHAAELHAEHGRYDCHVGRVSDWPLNTSETFGERSATRPVVCRTLVRHRLGRERARSHAEGTMLGEARRCGRRGRGRGSGRDRCVYWSVAEHAVESQCASEREPVGQRRERAAGLTSLSGYGTYERGVHG